jgi:hypothetical protein
MGFIGGATSATNEHLCCYGVYAELYVLKTVLYLVLGPGAFY